MFGTIFPRSAFRVPITLGVNQMAPSHSKILAAICQDGVEMMIPQLLFNRSRGDRVPQSGEVIKIEEPIVMLDLTPSAAGAAQLLKHEEQGHEKYIQHELEWSI